MAHQYGDDINLGQMTDEDVRELLVQRLDEETNFDVDAVEVEVRGGRIRIEGRVGTEGERQHVDQLMSSLGVVDYQNDVVVDRLARETRSEAADMAAVEDAAGTPQMGESSRSSSDTAQHLQPDDAGEMHGTRDPQRAVGEGKAYIPPDGPMQEGIEGDERH